MEGHWWTRGESKRKVGGNPAPEKGRDHAKRGGQEAKLRLRRCDRKRRDYCGLDWHEGKESGQREGGGWSGISGSIHFLKKNKRRDTEARGPEPWRAYISGVTCWHIPKKKGKKPFGGGGHSHSPQTGRNNKWQMSESRTDKKRLESN